MSLDGLPRTISGQVEINDTSPEQKSHSANAVTCGSVTEDKPSHPSSDDRMNARIPSRISSLRDEKWNICPQS